MDFSFVELVVLVIPLSHISVMLPLLVHDRNVISSQIPSVTCCKDQNLVIGF
jgi:hypothetical protein